MGKQLVGAMSKLLLKPADIPEFIEGLPNVLPLAKGKKIKQRDQIKPSVLDQDQYGVKRSYNYYGSHDMPQLNIQFASLKEQSLVYGVIPDNDPVDYHDVEVGQGNPENLADANEGLVTSAEQARISLDGAQSLRQLVTKCKNIFRLKLGADTPANMKSIVIKLREGAEPVLISARK
jgi:hypothetical protein